MAAPTQRTVGTSRSNRNHTIFRFKFQTLVVLITLAWILNIKSQPTSNLGGEQWTKTIQSTSIIETTDQSPLPPIVSTDKQISTQRLARRNSIVYLVQKFHSSYKRDSYGLLVKSLKLLFQNMKWILDPKEQVNVYLFHTGDYNVTDLQSLEAQLQVPPGTLLLVDLNNTVYWDLPSYVQDDDPATWKYPDQFTTGYRRMMRWYAISLWQFFDDMNRYCHANVEYIMRMDEDSFLLSPIDYNLFQFMNEKDYRYAFRQCSYEMGAILSTWGDYWSSVHSRAANDTLSTGLFHEPIRQVNKGLCGFYNNWFIARLDFFLSPPVQDFLMFVDRAGVIFRDRTNDLVLQTAVVYAFLPSVHVYRPLDFTYQHFSLKGGCPDWGALSGGSQDPHATQYLQQLYAKWENQSCPMGKVRLQEMTLQDLSPSFHHLNVANPANWSVPTISCYKVEVNEQGERSG